MEDAISPYATDAIELVSSARARPGSLRATTRSPAGKVDAPQAGDDEQRAEHVAEPAAAPELRRARDRGEAQRDEQERKDERAGPVEPHAAFFPAAIKTRAGLRRRT